MNTNQECLTLLEKWLQCHSRMKYGVGDPYAEQVMVATAKLQTLLNEAKATALEVMGDAEAYEAWAQPQLPFAFLVDAESVVPSANQERPDGG